MSNSIRDTRNEFIVYVDESGDHSLAKVDDTYPVFVLAFCVFYQDNYIENVISAIERLKFEKFGHDVVILHEREIRKETGPFRFRGKEDKNQFLGSLTRIIEESNFILISCVIDKRELDASAEDVGNPYHIALGHCLETLSDLLDEKGKSTSLTHVIFEERGKKEDAELELEFRRMCAGENDRGKKYPFAIKFASKQINSAGLQLADLVARPIGLSYLRPTQSNRAFDALKPKFFCEGGRSNAGKGFEGYGLKIFPNQKSEKPR
tara:strand:- start:117 stop:908 length:792 start_codon:yes stop_codon:yes gene_type:complete